MEFFAISDWVQLCVNVGIVISSVVSKIDIISSSGKLISWSNFFVIYDPSVGATEKSMLKENSWSSSLKTWSSDSEISQNVMIFSCNIISVNLETIFGNHLLKREIEIWRIGNTWQSEHVLHQVQRLKLETLFFRNIQLMEWHVFDLILRNLILNWLVFVNRHNFKEVS